MRGFMSYIIKPTKEAVRAWMERRRSHAEPLPDRERIRRELGWMLVAHPDPHRSRR